MYFFLVKVVKMMMKDIRSKDSLREKSGFENVIKETCRAQLVLLNNEFQSVKNFLISETLTIGRGMHNDIVIQDSFASHEHACISYYRGQYRLTDLSSTNGTYVNGNKVEKEVILHGGNGSAGNL